MTAKRAHSLKPLNRAQKKLEKVQGELTNFKVSLKKRASRDFDLWSDEYDTRPYTVEELDSHEETNSQVVSSYVPISEVQPQIDEVALTLARAIDNADYRGGSLQEDFINLQKENMELKAKLAMVPSPKPGFFAWIATLWRKVWKKS